MCKNRKKGDKNGVEIGRFTSGGKFVGKSMRMRDERLPAPTNSGGPRKKKK